MLLVVSIYLKTHNFEKSLSMTQSLRTTCVV